jgi:predicted MarR family transcription regulator
MDQQRLFDPNKYGRGSEPRPKKQKPLGVIVAVDDRWQLLGGASARAVPFAHLISGPYGAFGSWQAKCGKVGRKITVPDGTRYEACPGCAQIAGLSG